MISRPEYFRQSRPILVFSWVVKGDRSGNQTAKSQKEKEKCLHGGNSADEAIHRDQSQISRCLALVSRGRFLRNLRKGRRYGGANSGYRTHQTKEWRRGRRRIGGFSAPCPRRLFAQTGSRGLPRGHL